jgi:hypothetical protein
MSDLPLVPLPKEYIDAVRRERAARDESFIGTLEDIAGEPVLPMTLRHYHMLTQMKNGYVVPCKFESDPEALAHAHQFVWVVSRAFRWPEQVTGGFLDTLKDKRAQKKLQERLLRIDPLTLCRAVVKYMDDSFFDSPGYGQKSSAGGSSALTQPVASVIAYFADLFAAGGYCMSIREVMDMPLKQVWQFERLIAQRVYSKPALSNSEQIAADAISK